MRIFSKVMAWIGFILLLAAIGVAAKVSLDIYGNMQPKNSVPPINPYPWMWAAIAGCVLGGFLAGLGLGLASKYKALKRLTTPAPTAATATPPGSAGTDTASAQPETEPAPPAA